MVTFKTLEKKICIVNLSSYPKKTVKKYFKIILTLIFFKTLVIYNVSQTDKVLKSIGHTIFLINYVFCITCIVARE